MSAGSHKRAQGEPAFAQVCVAPRMPALLRPQFQVLDADNLKAIDRRLQHDDATRKEEEAIQARCASSRERSRAEAQRKIEAIQKRTARHANAAAMVEERRLQAEFRQLCNW
ncbi:hypothetical protein DQ04_11671010 [Trypanosoma grayi]|uniref:hypothetical protein n=1 Tax=Trypanosoma grayi TaxID=71804 RepID=UPI0004F40442|nr:hypothetical protein DQ04_11671010 [Trypanosoma grayi]KEG06914.1 hypothetical protein DQ04_11671010 [Trypanosoma grayi]